MSIYLTGDTHGSQLQGKWGLNRLSHKNWLEGKDLNKSDYVIIAGDFGLLFHSEQTKEEKWWLSWLEDKPWTTLFVCGNHENFVKLYELETISFCSGVVGKVNSSIFHLKRGEIYQIQGKKILTFGGAESIDKLNRIDGISWWKEEIPSYAEMDHCLDNLNEHNFKVDIIVAHTCPSFIVPMITNYSEYTLQDPTTKMLEHIVRSTTFEDYYCGHWHIDRDYGKYHFVYTEILKIA